MFTSEALETSLNCFFAYFMKMVWWFCVYDFKRHDFILANWWFIKPLYVGAFNTSFGLKCNHQPTNIHTYTKSIGKTRFFAYFLLIPWCNICEQDKHNTNLFYYTYTFSDSTFNMYIFYILNVNNFFFARKI